MTDDEDAVPWAVLAGSGPPPAGRTGRQAPSKWRPLRTPAALTTLHKYARLAKAFEKEDLPGLERLGWERLTILLDLRDAAAYERLRDKALEERWTSRELRQQVRKALGYRQERGKRQRRGQRGPVVPKQLDGGVGLQDLHRLTRCWLSFYEGA
jgi:hypothetical protein